MLEDYIKVDMKNLKSDQIRNYYQRVSDGELSPEFFRRKAQARRQKNYASQVK